MSSKPSKFSAILVTLINGAIIVAVLWWSGTFQDKTIYDEYRTKLDSIVIVVNDLSASNEFYTKVLNFPAAGKTELPKSSSFQLPDGQRITIIEKGNNNFTQMVTNIFSRPNAIVLQIRSKLEKFHAILVERNGASAKDLGEMSTILQKPIPRSISTIASLPWGQQFVVTDPDGNVFVFYKGNKKSTRWSLL